MAKKKKTVKTNSKQRVNPETLRQALITIRSRFKAGEVKSMKEIYGIYVTGMIAALGIGNEGYVSKFHNPEKFTIEDLLRLADVSETDFDLIWAVVKKEAMANHKKRNIDHLLNPVGIENSDQD